MILQDSDSIAEECKQAAMKTEGSRNQELLLSCSKEAANSYIAGQWRERNRPDQQSSKRDDPQSGQGSPTPSSQP